MDSFPAACDSINGRLVIDQAADADTNGGKITDLTPLSGILSVGTYLQVRDTDTLTMLKVLTSSR